MNAQEKFKKDMYCQMMCVFNFRSYLSKLYRRNVTLAEVSVTWRLTMAQRYRDSHPLN